MSLQPGTSVNPRFVFGVEGRLTNNLYLLQDHQLVYTAGHNVIVYSTEDKSQYFYSGNEETSGITALSLSPGKKYIAICERDEARGAQCTIFDTNTQRRRKTLNSTDFEAKEFVSVAFSPTSEGTYLITLTGAPDWRLVLWKWEKMTVEASIQVHPVAPEGGLAHCTFSPHDPGIVVVSGGGLYKYFVIKDKKIQEFHSSMNEKQDNPVGDRFSCHCWTSDGRLVVCTRDGEIIVCHDNGEFKLVLSDSPGADVEINTCTPFSRGLVLGGTKGEILVYEKTDDIDIPLKHMRALQVKLDRGMAEVPCITSMAITSTEDTVFFTLGNNQLQKLSIALDGTDDDATFSDVIYDFHSAEVTGLDICVRKQLIVTCSKDKSVRVWNYVSKKLEICKY